MPRTKRKQPFVVVLFDDGYDVMAATLAVVHFRHEGVKSKVVGVAKKQRIVSSSDLAIDSDMLLAEALAQAAEVSMVIIPKKVRKYDDRLAAFFAATQHAKYVVFRAGISDKRIGSNRVVMPDNQAEWERFFNGLQAE